MRVRRADHADVEALAALAALTFPLACPPHTTDEAKAAFIAAHLSEASFRRYLDDPARVIFVAEGEGALAGYTMLVAGEPTDTDVAAAVTLRPTVELSKCYVHPGAHGAGVASALMEAFYGKHGFTRVGVKRFLVGERYEDDYVYERPLR